MKCPKCGTELKEGTFYCENCGHDIHIVPDFEPELDINLQVELNGIGEELREEDAPEEIVPDDRPGKKSKMSAKHIFYMCGWILAAVLVIGIGIYLVKRYQYYSSDYQVSRAVQAMENVQYEKAVQYYNRAIELDRNNIELKFDLAEVYFLNNNKIEYENLLSEIIQSSYTDAEQLESAYGKLIAIYKAQEDYQTINDILADCKDEAIRSAYQGYLVETPEFSVPGGTYNSMTALKLTVTGKGTIYYTVNGTDPDVNSEQYTAPILLEKGRYVIKAFFVNENGAASEVVSAEYQIDAYELEEPEINVDSGDYNIAIFITVTNDRENIYYTTDGSEPTINSQQYTEPIPMPLGESVFRFVRLEAGQSSVTVSRTFKLVLQTDFTAAEAVAEILQYSLDSGKIIDAQGHYDDTEAHYRYQYLYVANINEISDFYIIAEVLVDSEENAARTGNYYAVNAYTGYYYKLQIANGIYTLSELG